MLKGSPVTFLMTFGHCGIDWMHSLLDSHDQILIPPALSFYRCWKMLNAQSVSDVGEMFDIWKIYITRYIGPNSHNEQKKFLHTNDEMELFFTEFRLCLESNGVDRVSVFWAVHESYAHAKGIDTNSIRSIVMHEHLPWPFEEMFSDFENANFLMMMRDPRAAIAGIIKGRKTDFGYLPDFTFNTIFETWFQGDDINKKYSSVLGNRLKIVRNEDLHDSLECNMRDVANWLQVEFSENMLVSTNSLGVIHIPDSRYINKDNQTINYSEFYSPENVRTRWLNVLSDKRDLLMIETLFRGIMDEFRYDRITKYTHISRIQGIILFLLPNHALLSKWLDDYPDIEDFSRIGDRLKKSAGVGYVIWKTLPSPIKLLFLITVSISRRIKLYLFPGDRWKRYDHDITKNLL